MASELALLSSGSATGAWSLWRGGRGSFFVTGTFDSATVKLQASIDQTNAVDVGSYVEFTAADVGNFDLGRSYIRAHVASAGGSTSVTATAVSMPATGHQAAVNELDICNRALILIGDDTITSMTQDAKRARVMNQLYDDTRNAELRDHNWNFAIKREALTVDVATPAWGYDKQYTLPAEFLRMVEVKGYDNPEDWKVEGQALVINDAGPVYIRYVQSITDVEMYDPLFVDALAARLAKEAAEPLTQSNTKRQLAMKEYDEVIRKAKRVDSIEDTPDEQNESSWIDARL